MYEGPCSAYSTPRDDLVIYVSCLVLTALIYVLLSYEQSRQAILVLLSIFLSHYHSTVCFTISWLNLLLLVLISRKIPDLCFWLQCIPALHLEYNQILRSLQTLQTCSRKLLQVDRSGTSWWPTSEASRYYKSVGYKNTTFKPTQTSITLSKPS